MPDQTLSNNQLLLTAAVNEVMKTDPGAADDPQKLLQKVSREFLNMKLDDFPRMCDVARVQNRIKFDNLRGLAKTGKYDMVNATETMWSDDGLFMYDFDIPEDLYNFMVHFVYKDFWAEDNGKVWRRFMKAICSRRSPMIAYDAMNLLIKVKQIYGANADLSLTR